MQHNIAIKHAWLENLELSSTLSPLALLVGDRVSDRFAISDSDDDVRVATLARAAWGALGGRFAALLRYDPLKATLSTLFANEDCVALTDFNSDMNRAGAQMPISPEALLDRLIDHPGSADFVVLVEDTDFLFGEPSTQAQLRIQRLIRIAENGSVNDDGRYAPLLVLSFRRSANIPEALLISSIREIRLGLPSRDERQGYALKYGSSVASQVPREVFSERLAAHTEGELLNTLQRVIDLAQQKEAKTASDVEHLARAVKEGLTDTPWAGRALRQALRQATERFGQRIKGQEKAINAVVRQLKRSALNLSMAQQNQASGGPRAVLFFAGPTGVGKTDLAKAIAELVFGDEGAMVRFDMGEFADAHADARLVGAPPGYVGFSQGGELTEAIRNRPFSVLLFDEIEKAHPKILDKFLALLDDGRVTDGRGNVSHFGESVVIFTSNLGAREASASQPFKDLERQVKGRVEEHFIQTINRPELLGRIGLENLIVFDFIRPDVARQILDKWINLYLARINGSQSVRVRLSDEAIRNLESYCLDLGVLSLGGRQIGKTLAARLVSPLAEILFDEESNAPIVVTGVHDDGISTEADD